VKAEYGYRLCRGMYTEYGYHLCDGMRDCILMFGYLTLAFCWSSIYHMKNALSKMQNVSFNFIVCVLGC
jgi:hypothetical protein